MKYVKYNTKNRTVKATLPSTYFEGLNTPLKQLTKAARQVVRDLAYHFRKDGWPINYSFEIEDVFYTAFGHHLENYLLKEMKRQLKGFSLESSKKGHGGLVITMNASDRAALNRPKGKASRQHKLKQSGTARRRKVASRSRG